MDFITFLDSLDSILVLNPDETILNLLEHNFFKDFFQIQDKPYCSLFPMELLLIKSTLLTWGV